MILGRTLDIITLPFRAALALLGHAVGGDRGESACAG
jgi:hypothetical protein